MNHPAHQGVGRKDSAADAFTTSAEERGKTEPLSIGGSPVEAHGRTSADRADVARRRFFQIWAIIGAIAIVYVLGFVLNVLSTPVAIVAWTAIIVLCLRTPVDKLESAGVPRAVGSAIAYVGMFIVLAVLGMVMFSPALGLGDQFASMLAGLPGYVQQLVDWGNQLYVQYADVLQNDTVRSWIDSGAKSLTDWASTVAKVSADGVVGFGTGVANSVMVIGFSLVVAFWILMELPAIGRETMRLIPPARREEAEMIHITFTRVMGGYIKATLLQCLLIGAACGICFQIVGIPNAAALGLITGVMNIIPVVGPWIGGALAALVGFFDSPLAALLALVFTIAIQQFVYTFVSPKIMANSVDVHPALVIIALLCGSAIGGAMQGLVGSVVGMLLSIPMVAIAKSIFVFYFERRTGRQVVSEDGVFFRGTPSHLDEEATRPDALTDAVGVASMREEEQAREEWRLREEARLLAMRYERGGAAKAATRSEPEPLSGDEGGDSAEKSAESRDSGENTPENR